MFSFSFHYNVHISKLMSGKQKMLKICLKSNSCFLLMFKMGAVTFLQSQFLRSCVCDQQMYIDTNVVLCAIQQPK